MDNNQVLRKRSLRSQVTDYIGEHIQIEDLSVPIYKKFYLKLKQKKNLEGGPGIKCANYPTEHFSSYQNCDEEFIFNTIRKFNVMPFWAASSLNKVTNLT